MQLHYFSLCCLLLTIAFGQLQATLRSFPPCESKIYCKGDLLDMVQTAKIKNDSKTFVDMKMKSSGSVILKEFEKVNRTDKENIIKFLNDYFDGVGQEWEIWHPTDWKRNPQFLGKINDTNLKSFAEKLNGIWKALGRKMRSSVQSEQDKYSIIYVEHPVIVPGGRFREFYYWDSYWIVQGLLVSEMYDTVKGMLENFLSLVNNLGFVPNGGRIYYDRSQPPLLIPMVKNYYDKVNNLTFLSEHIDTLEKELLFWLNNRTITLDVDARKYEVFIYNQSATTPRPESYNEDVNSAKDFNNSAKPEFYRQLRTAAESGWDFSSRWFVAPDTTHNGTLKDTKTNTIVPVELNAIIQWNCRLLSEFYGLIAEKSTSNNKEYLNKHNFYKKKAEELKEVLDTLLWNNEFGVWMDFDIANNKSRPYFYPTNLAPLWTESHKKVRSVNIKEGTNSVYGKEETKYVDSKEGNENIDFDSRVQRVLNYLNHPDVAIAKYEGGVPTSLLCTGEQWDYPNAWPPLQHMVILGLDNTNNEEAQKLSLSLCKKWVTSNYIAFNETGNMYEKYNATHMGKPGNGGEYEVQLGFGWSNGVILDLLDRYGDRLTLDTNSVPSGDYTKVCQNSAHCVSSCAFCYTIVIFWYLIVHLLIQEDM